MGASENFKRVTAYGTPNSAAFAAKVAAKGSEEVKGRKPSIM